MEKSNLIRVLMILLLILSALICLRDVIDAFNEAKYANNEDSKEYEEFDNIIEEEQLFYNGIKNKISDIKKEPYIFEGFKYLEGDINSGYVIEDQNENQYVWVPCNKYNLNKFYFCEDSFIDLKYCYDIEYKEFLNSVVENGGFYISRFEIGNEEGKAVSKMSVPIWNNVNRKEAQEIISNMYENVNCELINGYAYDATFKWLQNSSEYDIYEYDFKNSSSEIKCGRNKINNIYDFTDNIFELTIENDYDVCVVRGYFTDEKLYSRFAVDENAREMNEVLKLGFRTIIYK